MEWKKADPFTGDGQWCFKTKIGSVHRWAVKTGKGVQISKQIQAESNTHKLSESCHNLAHDLIDTVDLMIKTKVCWTQRQKTLDRKKENHNQDMCENKIASTTLTSKKHNCLMDPES